MPILQISPENTPGSSDSSKGSFNEKVFQYEHFSSPVKTVSPELLTSKKSPTTSPPFAGVRRKISYQPPGRSPLASEGSFDEQSNEASIGNASTSSSSIIAERRQSRPLLRGKSASHSRELLHECAMPLSLDCSTLNLSSSSKDLLSLFSTMKDSSMVSGHLSNSDRTPPTSPKSEDEGLKSLTRPSNRGKTSRSLDEISKLQSLAKNPFVSPTLRPKSISLRPVVQTESDVSGYLKDGNVSPTDEDSLIPFRTSMSSPTKASMQSSFQPAQHDRIVAKEFLQQKTTISQIDESPSIHLPSNKYLVKSKVNIIQNILFVRSLN